MTSYVSHFKLEKPPFSMTPDIEFYCGFTGQKGIIEDIVSSLNDGGGFIKVTGKAGVGKTLLSRKLLASLGSSFVAKCLYLADMSSQQFYNTVAEMLGLAAFNLSPNKILVRVEEKLLELHRAGKKMVLVIDDADLLTDEALDALRLLTNIETGSNRLMQIVLFAHTGFNDRLYAGGFEQLLQRITKSIEILPIVKDEIDLYLCHRLVTAGHSHGQLFTPAAKKLVFRHTGGIPRVINILCSKALLLSYQKGLDKVDVVEIRASIKDSREALISIEKNKCKNWLWEALLVFAFAVAALLCWAVYNVVYLST